MGQTEVDQRGPAVAVDLRGTLCPLNWVRTKLELEELAPGRTLEITLDDGEPMRNVPRSVKAEGHTVLKVEPLADGSFRLLIRRGEG